MEKLIEQYSKKIFGFAWSKTGDAYQAEELSQEILTALLSTGLQDMNIDNMDAYIYRVCSYTWSKYLRKNKPHWEALNNVTQFELLRDSSDPEQEIIDRELHQRLRQEIAYLGKLRREILVMFYYDNMTGDEISQKLGISSSTVRWHLQKTRKKLKERITMTGYSEIYKPVKLKVGHSGFVNRADMDGLVSDTLTQNLCYICYGKAMTIEEMAAKLSVAAVYLEDRVEKLLFMDYLKPVGANKYQTNFFIADERFVVASARYLCRNIMTVALPVFKAVRACLPTIKSFGVAGSQLSDEELLWDILPIVMRKKCSQLAERMIKEKGLGHRKPIRKDGSEHWVWATEKIVPGDSWEEDVKDFLENSVCHGVKWREEECIRSWQVDMAMFGDWRDFDGDDLRQLKRIKSLMDNSEELNEYDKTVMAAMAEKGYIEVNNGKATFLIPYFTRHQMEVAEEILDRHLGVFFDEEAAYEVFCGYICEMEKYIPDFIDSNERAFILTSFDVPDAPAFYMLLKQGYLTQPNDQQKKRICTVVWEIER